MRFALLAVAALVVAPSLAVAHGGGYAPQFAQPVYQVQQVQQFKAIQPVVVQRLQAVQYAQPVVVQQVQKVQKVQAVKQVQRVKVQQARPQRIIERRGPLGLFRSRTVIR